MRKIKKSSVSVCLAALLLITSSVSVFAAHRPGCQNINLAPVCGSVVSTQNGGTHLNDKDKTCTITTYIVSHSYVCNQCNSTITTGVNKACYVEHSVCGKTILPH